MWIDTKINGEFQLINMNWQKQLSIRRAERLGTAWHLKFGTGTFGAVIGIFEDLPTAVAEYENICEALKRGDKYYKIRAEITGEVANEQESP